MTNAQILSILSGLSAAPRPLAELLPGATRAEVREAADYLGSTGLADIRMREGVPVATIALVGQLFLEKARARGDATGRPGRAQAP
jgi:hypothetical protein